MEPRAIVVRAAGTNCQYETEAALRRAGFSVEIAHINELVRGSKKLNAYDFLAIPGGFSGGDYLGAGKLFANKIAFGLGDQINDFVDNGKLVIGICNGFQVLVKTGLLPGFDSERKQLCTLAINSSGHFQCQWIKLKAAKSNCVFSKGIKELEAPIAHGEGRFTAGTSVIEKLFENRQVVFTYAKNPNGSIRDIAGICDRKGLVLGLMPHPERNASELNNPHSSEKGLSGEGAGMKVFRNAFDYFTH